MKLDSDVKQHIFSYNEIDVYEDKSGKLTIAEISSQELAPLFKGSKTFVPKTTHSLSTYWYKVIVLAPNTENQRISIADLKPGLYLLRTDSQAQTFIKK